MLFVHITIALVSVAFSTYLYFTPSRTKLRASYVLVVSTVATGIYLVIASQAAMLRTCMMGLLYVGVMVVIIAVAHNKLLALERVKPK